jgi:hypothetical protein
MKQLVTMRDALADPALLGNILAGDSWTAWRVVLIAALGEALSPDERVIFQQLTGREIEPGEPIEELIALIGRRGGKTRAAATAATYLGALCDHSAITAPGERPLVLCLGQNQKQAGVCFGYICGAFESSPMLAPLITNRTADTLELSTGVNIEVRAASARGLRGITAAAVIGDEACFWSTDENSVNADSEILTAVRPCLATTGGPLVIISSPFAKRGEVFEIWREHYGPKGDKRILVLQGASRDFNPSLPQSVVDRAMKRDPAAARAEYLGEWRDDIESFITADVVDACVVSGRTELLPDSAQGFVCFVDVSGGVHDAHCCAISYKDQITEKAVLAAAREIKSENTEAVVQEFAAMMRSYGLHTAYSDRFAARWVFDAFARANVQLRYSSKSKSELYLDVLYAMRAKRVELLDLPRLRGQLLNLQRRVTTTGRDIILDGGKSDDLANAVSGSLYLATTDVADTGPRYIGVGTPIGEEGEMTEADWDRIRGRILCGDLSKITEELLRQ